MKRVDSEALSNEKDKTPQSFFFKWVKKSIAHILILAVVISAAPTVGKAAWRDQSSSLPGLTSGKVVALALVGLGAVVGLVVYIKVRGKGDVKLKVDAPSAKFKDVVKGQSTKKTVPVTNLMNESLTVKSLNIKDNSGAFTMENARQVPFTLAPGETFEIPVMLSPKKNSGKAQLQIVASAPKFKKDRMKTIDLSYSD
jgi:hypothetical protein